MLCVCEQEHGIFQTRVSTSMKVNNEHKIWLPSHGKYILYQFRTTLKTNSDYFSRVEEVHTTILQGSFLEDLTVNSRKILKPIVKKWNAGLNSSGSKE